MNESAHLTIQCRIQHLDRELYKYVNELISGQSLISDEHLKIIIDSTEREIRMYEYIFKLIVNDTNKN